jgi:2'-5' RNA ligase
MALAVCLLLDPDADAAVRRVWSRLEAAGVATLLSHTHGRHVPHLSYASLRSYDLDGVAARLAELPQRPPMTLYLDALGTFRRSRCWLGPAVTSDLAERQAAVVSALTAAGADLHRNYRVGAWIPHITLSPRLHLRDLPTVAGIVYDVLPIVATTSAAALVDTSTGRRYPLPHLV